MPGKSEETRRIADKVLRACLYERHSFGVMTIESERHLETLDFVLICLDDVVIGFSTLLDTEHLINLTTPWR